MSNKYIEEAMEKNKNKFLPETMEEFSLLSTADANRVPMAHIQKLRDELSGKGKKESNFVKNNIKWDN
jgi:uncharacterized protein (DUF2267 family)